MTSNVNQICQYAGKNDGKSRKNLFILIIFKFHDIEINYLIIRKIYITRKLVNSPPVKEISREIYKKVKIV